MASRVRVPYAPRSEEEFSVRWGESSSFLYADKNGAPGVRSFPHFARGAACLCHAGGSPVAVHRVQRGAIRRAGLCAPRLCQAPAMKAS